MDEHAMPSKPFRPMTCPALYCTPVRTGFLIRDVNMPPWWRWYSYICSSKYACECRAHQKVTGHCLKPSAWTQHSTGCDRGQGAGLGAGCVAVAGDGRLVALVASARHAACGQSSAAPWWEEPARTGHCGIWCLRLAWLFVLQHLPAGHSIDTHACILAAVCCAGGAK